MLKIIDLHFRANKHSLDILKNINLEIFNNDIIALMGSSGSGKSTILKCINLINKPYLGKIILNNETIMDHENKIFPKGAKLNNYRSHIGKVFQHFNLFPNLNVLENLILAPVIQNKLSKEDAKDKALELLKSVDLKSYEKRSINDLSGGQKQRVAVIRSLMMEPKLMLFDEPTSALDPENKQEVLSIIMNLKGKIPLVLVTHEILFAKKIATHIAFVEKGEIIEKTKSNQFFESPTTQKAKSFINKVSMLWN